MCEVDGTQYAIHHAMVHGLVTTNARHWRRYFGSCSLI